MATTKTDPKLVSTKKQNYACILLQLWCMIISEIITEQFQHECMFFIQVTSTDFSSRSRSSSDFLIFIDDLSAEIQISDMNLSKTNTRFEIWQFAIY